MCTEITCTREPHQTVNLADKNPIYLCIPHPSSWPGVKWIAHSHLGEADTETRKKCPGPRRWNSRWFFFFKLSVMVSNYLLDKKNLTAYSGATVMAFDPSREEEPAYRLAAMSVCLVLYLLLVVLFCFFHLLYGYFKIPWEENHYT